MDKEKQILAQRYQLCSAENRIVELNENVRELKQHFNAQAETLDELEQDIDQLLFELGMTEKDWTQIIYEDILTEDEKLRIVDEIKKLSKITVLRYENEEQYQKTVEKYLKECGFNIENDPIMELFAHDELMQQLRAYEDKYGKLKWDKSDYIVIGMVAVISFLIDYFIVSIPEPMRFFGKDYVGSTVTLKLKEVTTQWTKDKNSKIGKLLHELENWAKVPYDISTNNKAKGIFVEGNSTHLHRLMEPGHDPIVGFVVGVADILRGSCTIIDKNGMLQVMQNGEGTYNIFEAFLKFFAHLLSDVFTKTGLPCPFMSLLQLCAGESPFILRKNGEKVSFTDVARFMYKHGYDMRHFATMSLETVFIELSIRTYYNLYYFDDLLDYKNDARHHLKKNNMLLAAHTIAVGENILKTWMYGWNPLALNYTEFLTLVVSMFRSIRANGKYKDMVVQHITEEWVDILVNS